MIIYVCSKPLFLIQYFTNIAFNCDTQPSSEKVSISLCQVLREERLVAHFTEEGCMSQLKAIFVKYCIQNKGFEHT